MKKLKLLTCLSVLISLSAFQLHAQTCGLSLNHINVTCIGDQDGVLEIDVANGTPPYTATWTDGFGSPLPPAVLALLPTTLTSNGLTSYTGLPTGSYLLSLSNGGNCVGFALSTIGTDPDTTPPTATCGGGTFFAYANSGNCEEAIIDFAADVEALMMPSDNCGVAYIDCSAPSGSSFPIGQTPVVCWAYDFAGNSGPSCTYIVEVLPGAPMPYLNTTMIDASCWGGSDGSIDIAVYLGTAPFSFSWSNGATTEDISNLSAGIYTLTVTDANGCTSEPFTATVAEPSPLVISAATSDISCNGSADGAINVGAAGGTLPYSFLWTNGATTENLSNLAAGTYTLFITDANGCNISTTATIIEPPVLEVSVSSSPATCTGSDGTIDLTVIGGTAPYNYFWTNEATSEDQNNLPAGTYSVLITDANGCSSAYTAEVQEDCCPATLLIPGNIPSNLYQAGQSITSNGTVPPGGTVDFKAGQIISLISGFTVQPQADFSAEIEGCN